MTLEELRALVPEDFKVMCRRHNHPINWHTAIRIETRKGSAFEIEWECEDERNA